MCREGEKNNVEKLKFISPGTAGDAADVAVLLMLLMSKPTKPIPKTHNILLQIHVFRALQELLISMCVCETTTD
jgi:hypothetical protein